MNEHRTIPLTRGLETLVDAADYDWLNQWKWHVSNAGYVMRRDGKYGRLVLMHRLITGLDGVSPKVSVPDHINRNPLDNRRGNLRVVSNSSNAQNRPAIGASGFVGVYKRKSKAGPVWQAMIQCDRRSYSLGQYRTPEQASKAREAAAAAFREGRLPRRRTKRGEDNASAVLRGDQIDQIRALLGAGVGFTTLAGLYGVTKQAIYWIKVGRNWAHRP